MYVKYIKVEELTAKQRAELKKALQQEVRGLQAALKAVDGGLKKLSAAPKLKKTTKRKTTGRTTKGRLPQDAPE